jgi:hypothetical protein
MSHPADGVGVTEKLIEPVGEMENVGDFDCAVRVVVDDAVTVDVKAAERVCDGEADAAPVDDGDTERDRVPDPERDGEPVVLADRVGSATVRETVGDCFGLRVSRADDETDALPEGASDALAGDADAEPDGLGESVARDDSEGEADALGLGDSELLGEPVKLDEPDGDGDAGGEPDGERVDASDVVRVAIESCDVAGDTDAVTVTEPDRGGERVGVDAADCDAERGPDALGAREPVPLAVALGVAEASGEGVAPADADAGGETEPDGDPDTDGDAGAVRETVGEPLGNRLRVSVAEMEVRAVGDDVRLDDDEFRGDDEPRGDRDAIVADDEPETLRVRLGLADAEGDVDALSLPLARSVADAFADGES